MYANSSSVRDARAQYFAANGFSEESYRERWVKLKVGPVPLAIPNSPSRKRAVPLHDLHHVATGYATTWAGEGEIGAYEIAAGCGRYAAAWFLNAGAFAVGLVIAPRRVYRAFIRGRHARTLYREGWRDEMLDLSVGELRHRLGLDTIAAATWSDRLAFAAWVAIVAAPAATAAVLLPWLW